MVITQLPQHMKKAAVCMWGLLDNNLDIKIYVYLFYTQTSQ